jgi:hypothetical protein
MNCCCCSDPLPSVAPAGVTSCHSYADALARQRGEILPAAEAHVLTLLAWLCELDVAFRDGLEVLPDLDLAASEPLGAALREQMHAPVHLPVSPSTFLSGA